MKHLLRSVLLLAAPLYIYGQAKPAEKSLTPTAGASIEQTLKQIERDWGNAEIKKDYAAVDKILAEDWMGIDYDGKVIAKTKVMEDMKSGTSTLSAEELGPMNVRVFGETAVVTGGDTEKSTDRGKDSSGKYVWTDVFVLRDGRWQAIASQSTRAQ
jgi:ketosteroid isomerase-like protein